MKSYIQQKAEEYFPEYQSFRHHIHANPELSFQEVNTARFVAEQLERWGIPHQTQVAGTGIVALIKGKNPDANCIAVRADMDALPIEEANEVAYRSRNPGVMHACGHDVHTSCLLGVARILHEIRDQWEGTVKLIFQPGEEKHPGGASMMIAEGVLENPVPSAIFALHVYPHMPTGALGFRSGQYMASADEIYITIKGRGGHAAMPHQTIDPITMAAQLITQLQQVVSRKANPLIPTVLSFGKISGGLANNVIPDQVELQGTFRTLDEPWRQEAHNWIRQMSQEVIHSLGGEVEVEIPRGYPSLFNDPDLTEKARSWAEAFMGKDKVQTLNLRMAAEDFSYYAQKIPACFFRLGTNQDGKRFTAPVHNAQFDIDETSMKTGVGTMSWLVIQALNQTKE